MRDPVDELIHAARSAVALIGQMDADWVLERRLEKAIKAVEQQRERKGLYVIDGGGQHFETDDKETAKLTALGLVLTGADSVKVTDRDGVVVLQQKKGA